MAFYKFVGDGVGVPGLPHQISDVQAVSLGVVDILESAIRNGSYVVVGDAAINPPVAGATSPQMEERHLEGVNNKKKKGVTNG
jgi:hypothetical protein